MRIACTNHHRQIVGGTESYLHRVIPEFTRLGHEVSLWHEGSVAPGTSAIDAPEVFPIGADSPQRLRAWKPDVIYNNGLMGMEWEGSLAGIAPVVHFAHNYYGTCISGEKTRRFPVPVPCDRCFGPACLVQYFPRRCGGLSPLTMWHDYQLQSMRLEHLRHFAAIVTASRHIENEYRKYGLARVIRAPLFVESQAPVTGSEGQPHRILFCGRMMKLKGGNLLLDAIPEIERLIGRPIQVTMAGDGPERSTWENRKSKAKFTGWLPQAALRELASQQDVLAMPSIWPEPFGLAGLELGLPVAAFAVGGIPDWLVDGVNGHIAPQGQFAIAVAACLRDRTHWQTLQAGAVDSARQFSLERHLAALLPVFESVV